MKTLRTSVMFPEGWRLGQVVFDVSVFLPASYYPGYSAYLTTPTPVRGLLSNQESWEKKKEVAR